MGIIQRQSIKHTLVQYSGIVFGVISMLYIYPKVAEAYGLAQTLFAAAFFLAPVVSMGTWVMAVKFFPDFKNEKTNHNGFLGLLLLIAGIGFTIFLISFPILKSYISEYLFQGDKPAWYFEFLPYVVPFTFFVVFNRLLSVFASNFHRIVIPSILEEFLLKIVLPVLILLFYNEIIPIQWVIYGILINYSIGTVGLTFYLWTLGQANPRLKLNFISKKLRSSMLKYGSYGVVNAVGTQGAFKIDTLMVSGEINLETTGFYSQANFFAEAMSKPQKSIIGIAGPLISKALQNNNLQEVKTIYKKSSVTLLIIGLFLFIGLWTCIDDLFTIMDNPKIETIRYAFLFLCLAKLVNMGTSVNNEIINYSKYYRFNFWMILILAVMNISLNFWIIPIYGAEGVAFATFFSFLIFNLAKLIFIKIKFGFHPFSMKTIAILLLAVGIYFISTLLPDLGNPYLNIILKGGLITLTYPFLVFKMNISKDYNQLITSGLNNFFKK